MPQNKLPDFLIVGAPKCATTSLYGYLTAHPNVYMSAERKEGRFFSEIGTGKVFWPKNYPYPCPSTLEDYKKLFSGHNGQKLIGDVSPDYFAYADITIPNILKHCGKDTKIIIMVRNPIERTFSHYLQNVRRGAEHFSFAKALEIEPIRTRDNWGFQWLYAGTSLYAERIRKYQKNFTNVLVLSKHDMDNNPENTLRRLHDYLGIAYHPGIEVPRLNTGGVQQSKIDTVLQGDFDDREEELLDKTRYAGEEIKKGPATDTSFDQGGKLVSLTPADIHPTLYTELENRFKPDIIAMQNEYGIDLSTEIHHARKSA